MLACVFKKQHRYDDDDDEDGHGPDQYLEQGMPLPIRMSAAFDPDLAGVPLEDFDPFYQNIAVIWNIIIHVFEHDGWLVLSVMSNIHKQDMTCVSELSYFWMHAIRLSWSSARKRIFSGSVQLKGFIYSLHGIPSEERR